MWEFCSADWPPSNWFEKDIKDFVLGCYHRTSRLHALQVGGWWARVEGAVDNVNLGAQQQVCFEQSKILAVAGCRGQQGLLCWPKLTKKSTFSRKYEDKLIIQSNFGWLVLLGSMKSAVSQQNRYCSILCGVSERHQLSIRSQVCDAKTSELTCALPVISKL